MTIDKYRLRRECDVPSVSHIKVARESMCSCPLTSNHPTSVCLLGKRRNKLKVKMVKRHNSLISYPNHVPQSPKFIFCHSLSFQPIEILNKSLKWWNHQRSAKVLRVEANDTPRLRILQFLPPFPHPHCSHQKNNIYSTQTSLSLNRQIPNK